MVYVTAEAKKSWRRATLRSSLKQGPKIWHQDLISPSAPLTFSPTLLHARYSFCRGSVSGRWSVGCSTRQDKCLSPLPASTAASLGLNSFLHISRALSSLGFALVPMVRGGSRFSQGRKEERERGMGYSSPLGT